MNTSQTQQHSTLAHSTALPKFLRVTNASSHRSDSFDKMNEKEKLPDDHRRAAIAVIRAYAKSCPEDFKRIADEILYGENKG